VLLTDPESAERRVLNDAFELNFLLLARVLSLRAFARLRKATAIKELDSQWNDFHEIWHLSTSNTSVEKVQESLKSDKNNDNLTQR
jgi:hypothetical protein